MGSRDIFLLYFPSFFLIYVLHVLFHVLLV